MDSAWKKKKDILTHVPTIKKKKKKNDKNMNIAFI